MKTVVRICFVQTLQRVKVNRCLESNEDSINAQPKGKTKFLSNFAADSLVEIARRILKAAKFFRETEAKRLRPELLQPYPAKVPPNSWQDC